jgi:hypothetical protein
MSDKLIPRNTCHPDFEFAKTKDRKERHPEQREGPAVSATYRKTTNQPVGAENLFRPCPIC